MEYFHGLHKTLGTAGLVVTSATTLVVGAIWAYHLNLSLKRKGEVPIVWSWIPILGSAIEFGSRPSEFQEECAQKNEDIFGIVIAGQRMFIITDPHSGNVVLKPTKDLTWEVFQNAVLADFFGAKGKKLHF